MTLRSKTLATWIAFLFGSLGLHRFYLKDTRDLWGWAHVPPTVLGLYGIWRMLELGQDDRIAWALIPLLGLSLSASMLAAIVYGLTPDETWNAQHHGGSATTRPSGWLAVLGVIAAVFVGATVLISTIAFSGQRFFESQVGDTRSLGQ